MNNRVYFAGPWFSKAQEEREERLKKKLRDLGFDVFSPKEESNINNTFISQNIQRDTFERNIINIEAADIIFAICDGKQCKIVEEDQLDRPYNAIDSGTMIECGVAYTLKRHGKDIIIIYYSETLGDKPFNLMLAQSADLVITEYEDLDNLPEYIEKLRSGEKIRDFEGMIE